MVRKANKKPFGVHPKRLFSHIFRFEAGHKLQFEEVCLVQAVNALFGLLVVNFARAYISVEHRIGKAEVVFVGLSAKSVGRHLFN